MRVRESRIADQCSATAWEVGLDREPLALLRVIECGEAGPVLVIASGELDVIEDHPDVNCVELRQGGKAG